LPLESDGEVLLMPIPPTTEEPPFTPGSQFVYFCEDSVNFQITSNSGFMITECQSNGMFTLDTSPPSCEQISKFLLLQSSEITNYNN